MLQRSLIKQSIHLRRMCGASVLYCGSVSVRAKHQRSLMWETRNFGKWPTITWRKGDALQNPVVVMTRCMTWCRSAGNGRQINDPRSIKSFLGVCKYIYQSMSTFIYTDRRYLYCVIFLFTYSRSWNGVFICQAYQGNINTFL